MNKQKLIDRREAIIEEWMELQSECSRLYREKLRIDKLLENDEEERCTGKPLEGTGGYHPGTDTLF